MLFLFCGVFAVLVSCMRQSAKMLYQLCVGIFDVFSVSVSIFLVGLESDSDRGLGMLSGLPLGRRPCVCPRFLRFALLLASSSRGTYS